MEIEFVTPPPSALESLGISPSKIDAIRAWIEERADGEGRGYLVQIWCRGADIISAAGGTVGTGANVVQLHRDSIIPLASNTKSITAAAAFVLVERGLLALDTRVQEFFPDLLGRGKEAITVHHLLTHTSGIEDERVHSLAASTGRLSPGGTRMVDISREDVVSLVGEMNLTHYPGTQVAYSNFAFWLIGEIVEQLTEMAFEDFCAAHLFAPLRMVDTSFELAANGRFVDTGAPHGHGLTGTRLEPWAAGGAMATMSDMVRFSRMLLGGAGGLNHRVLTEASVRDDQIAGRSNAVARVLREAARWSRCGLRLVRSWHETLRPRAGLAQQFRPCRQFGYKPRRRSRSRDSRFLIQP